MEILEDLFGHLTEKDHFKNCLIPPYTGLPSCKGIRTCILKEIKSHYLNTDLISNRIIIKDRRVATGRTFRIYRGSS